MFASEKGFRHCMHITNIYRCMQMCSSAGSFFGANESARCRFCSDVFSLKEAVFQAARCFEAQDQERLCKKYGRCCIHCRRIMPNVAAHVMHESFRLHSCMPKPRLIRKKKCGPCSFPESNDSARCRLVVAIMADQYDLVLLLR